MDTQPKEIEESDKEIWPDWLSGRVEQLSREMGEELIFGNNPPLNRRCRQGEVDVLLLFSFDFLASARLVLTSLTNTIRILAFRAAIEHDTSA
jgi:hypothetical protein